MMYDKQFLNWIHDRLVNKHSENPNADYMHKLRAIIAATDDEEYTPNVASRWLPVNKDIDATADKAVNAAQQREDRKQMKFKHADNRLEHVLKTAILFVLNEMRGHQSETGCEEMYKMLCDELCNQIGDDKFCEWMEEK